MRKTNGEDSMLAYSTKYYRSELSFIYLIFSATNFSLVDEIDGDLKHEKIR
jgi:hypothetical protein